MLRAEREVRFGQFHRSPQFQNAQAGFAAR